MTLSGSKKSDTTTAELRDADRTQLVVSSPSGVTRRSIERGQALLLGRAPECDVVLDDDSVSRRHARIVGGEPPIIEDLGSRNGTVVRTRRLEPRRPEPLAFGTVAQLGAALVVVIHGAPSRDTKVHSTRSSKSVDAHPIIADPAMQRLYALLGVIARSDLSVLLLGETGTGKEVCARAIHDGSARARKPFVALNCARMSDALLDSELFGYEKGAFTGAASAKAGLLESADGGTVFLDEIGEMPLSAQAKLLRALQSGEILRLGSLRPRRVDVRLVCATNRDLELAMGEGQFRADLFYRINGFIATVPPLRERPADILPLARHYLRKTARAVAQRAPAFTEAAEAALLAHSWPGNVRELRTTVERAFVLAEGAKQIDADDLGLRAPSRRATKGSTEAGATLPPPGEASFERERMLEALARSHGNQKEAAKLLGISRQTLSARLKRYGIGRPRRGLG